MTEDQVRAIAREEIAAATSIVHKPDEVAAAQQTLIEAGLLAQGESDGGGRFHRLCRSAAGTSVESTQDRR